MPWSWYKAVRVVAGSRKSLLMGQDEVESFFGIEKGDVTAANGDKRASSWKATAAVVAGGSALAAGGAGRSVAVAVATCAGSGLGCLG